MKKLLLTTLLFTMAAAGVSAQDEVSYCEPSLKTTRTDRYANNVQIAGESQTFTFSDLPSATARGIYEKHLDFVITCRPGEVLTPQINYTGSWMHKFVYVDWDKNGTFDVAAGTAGQTTDWGELVSANYMNVYSMDNDGMEQEQTANSSGWTSAGVVAPRDGTAALPSFTVPADASGDYRIRFKLDWYSTDPCGYTVEGKNHITTNGGQIIDLTLRVENKTAAPVFSPASCEFPAGTTQEITITSSTEGATIYYTLDGTKPTDASQTIENGGTVSVPVDDWRVITTVKAFASAAGKDPSNVTSAVYTVESPYCDLDGLTETRTDRTQNEGNDNRHVDAISVTGSSVEDFSGSGYGDAAHRPIYEKHLDQVIVCCPGDVLQPSVTYDGEWMHKYVYVDWGKDGVFDVETGIAGEATGWGDLVSYNYIGDKTSAGEETTNQGLKKLGSFTVPADASGDYVIRFKIDWDDTDPCVGSDRYTSIANNGGAVIDLTLRVKDATALPQIGLASGSNIPKGVTEISVSSNEDGAVIYYTTDGTDPDENSAKVENGVIALDATSAAWGDIITVKAVAKVADKDLSGVATAEYCVYPYCYLPGNKSTENWAYVTTLSTSKGNYDLNYTNANTTTNISYLQIIDAATSGLRVKKGETFDLNYGWTNAWWSGFSLFMDKGAGSLEEIFFGGCINTTGDLYDANATLPAEFNGTGKVSVSIAAEASYGEYLLRAVVANTHDACATDKAQKIIDVFYTVCPAITVNAAEAAQGKVKVSADGSETELSDAKELLIPAGSKITLTAEPAEGYIFSKWVNADGGELSTEATFEYVSSEDVTISAEFASEAPVPTEDKEVTADTEETGDAAYVNVTVKTTVSTTEVTWTVGENTVSAQSLDIEIAADATTPEIALSGSGTITAGTISVNRAVKAGEWAFMSLPFAIDIANVTVGGDAAVIDGNIRFLVYDGAQRANTSVEGYTKSGWTEKASGTIDANTGFAVAVNDNNGDEQTVTFTAANFTMDASDKEIALSKYPAEVNDGMDADWNFKGNPMLQTADKGEGYSLYLYNPGDDTYDEYAGMESAIFAPFAAWFVQSTGLTGGITFSHDGTSVAADSEASKDGLFAVSINGGEDEARITVAGGTSQSYVINEDAMYFAPNSRKVSQLYLIDEDGAKIASSVVPEPYAEVRLAYDAVTAGEQTLTVTSLIPGTAVTLVDNETGKAMQMGEGSEYTFTSAAGLDSDRFVLKTAKVDLSGIETAGAEASGISAVASGGTITVYGAEAGSVISVYTVNGAMVSSTVAADEETVLPVSVNGVLLVKAGEEVIKVVK